MKQNLCLFPYNLGKAFYMFFENFLQIFFEIRLNTFPVTRFLNKGKNHIIVCRQKNLDFSLDSVFNI